MNQTNTQITDRYLKAVPAYTVGVGCTISMILFIIYQKEALSLGAVMGTVFAVANFIFLTKIVVKLLDQNYKRKSILALLFAGKLMFIIGFLLFAFWMVKVDAVGFILGYGSLIPVVLIQQLRLGSKLTT